MPIMRLATEILFLSIALAGCAVNGFEKFYTPAAGSDLILGNPSTLKSTTEPKVFNHSTDTAADALRLAEDGYILIGTSSFFGASAQITQQQALAQGKKVGATVVLIKYQYKDTLTGSVPLVLPNAPVVSTVNTTGIVNSGYGGSTYNSTSTITSPGGVTAYQIPYAVARSDVFATYWVKQDTSKMRLGVRVDRLPEEARRRLQRNTGVSIAVVVHGTPAFSANILRGDFVLRINEEDVVDPTGFVAQLAKFGGQQVSLTIMRGEEEKVVVVKLGL